MKNIDIIVQCYVKIYLNGRKAIHRAKDETNEKNNL